MDIDGPCGPCVRKMFKAVKSTTWAAWASFVWGSATSFARNAMVPGLVFCHRIPWMLPTTESSNRLLDVFILTVFDALCSPSLQAEGFVAGTR